MAKEMLNKIENALHEHIVSTSKRERSERVKGMEHMFSASSTGYCYLNQWFKITNPELAVAPEAKSQRIMRLGTLIHEDFEKALGNAFGGDECLVEGDIHLPELNLRGSFDAAFRIDSTTAAVVDFKSIGSFGYKLQFGRDAMKKGKTTIKRGHALQLGIYAHGIKEEWEYETVLMYLVYYNKDTSMLRIREIPQSYIDEAVEYWEDVNEILEIENGHTKIENLDMALERMTPEIDLGVPMENWQCSYCDFYNSCPSTLSKKKRK